MMDEYEKYDSGSLLKNRYSKVADLSEGSYGLVSVAKDTQNNDKLIAVKFIYPIDYKSGEDPKDSQRAISSPARLRSNMASSSDVSVKSPVRSKASILKTLYEEAAKEIKIHQILGEHPNISTLYDHFDSCLVLEYCSRGDLYEAIQNGQGPSSSHDIKDVFFQILNALEFCHSHNVYHRDLKPENILITEDWSIKLCDWGLATTTRKITNKNEFDVGSERYMAPELFDTKLESYDASKIDIWSVGIILLTLVFRKNPFQVANYSDKRFLQFAANREALFDIFSTMSGDMFSVLRYCLNIDPTNRDLSSLKTELNLLKYFTYDEEDWASDYEEEFEEDECAENGGNGRNDLDLELNSMPNYNEYNDFDLNFNTEDDDFNFNSGVDTFSSGTDVGSKKDEDEEVDSSIKHPTDQEKSNILPPPLITTTDADQEHDSSKSINGNDSLEDNEAPREIPYNHRADALLSASTDLKPISIASGGHKFIRNTRKPFNVASYNQSHKLGASYQIHNNNHNSYNHNKFAREDFFTPKSMFNHYMDKYGEQKSHSSRNNGHGGNHYNNYFKQSNNNYSRQNRSDWKKNGKKRQSWNSNKNSTHNNPHNNNNHYNRNNQSNYQSQNYHGYQSNKNRGNRSSINGRHYNNNDVNGYKKRQSSLFSSSKSRKNIVLSIANSNNIDGSLTGSLHQLNYQSSHNPHTGSPGSTGKYIPPYLRSPNFKSPVIEPLTEEIDNLTLDNDSTIVADDEVFHLEDDFDIAFNHNDSNETNKSLSLSNTNATLPTTNTQSDITYKKPTFKAPTYTLPSLNNEFSKSNGNSHRNFNLNSTSIPNTACGTSHRNTATGRRHSINRFSDVHSTSIASSPSGKYIPPFRRGSHSAASSTNNPTAVKSKNISNNTGCSNGANGSGNRKEFRRSGFFENDSNHSNNIDIQNTNHDINNNEHNNNKNHDPIDDRNEGFQLHNRNFDHSHHFNHDSNHHFNQDRNHDDNHNYRELLGSGSNTITSSSVPLSKTDWFPKKSWIDYDES